MPDHEFLAAAYEPGQIIRRALPWMVLLAIALMLVIRVACRSFSFRRSRLGLGLSLVAAVVCVTGSLHYDFGGPASARAGSDMNAAREEVMLGCLDQNQPRSVCECYGDEVLRRLDRSSDRFAALEREMVKRQNAGQSPPAMLTKAAQACAGRKG